MANQFIRKITLIVSNDSGQGLDLSEFRIRFHTQQSDVETPNTLWARVYNLSDATIQKIKNEFQTVTLQAGYENGNFGIIFQGTIKQWWEGRERNVDSFFEITAADGDIFYNFAVICQSIASGQSPQQELESIFSQGQYSAGLPLSEDASGLIGGVPAQALARGKVKFGMARDYARDWSAKYGYQWSIQNGKATVVPLTGYRPGEAVVLSPNTGLVGIPEATNDGVYARALLNPKIQVGCLVQIAQSDLNTLTIVQQGLRYGGTPAAAAITTAAGFYRVLVAEFHGDTRGQEWYVDLTCLAVDITAPHDQSVLASG